MAMQHHRLSTLLSFITATILLGACHTAGLESESFDGDGDGDGGGGAEAGSESPGEDEDAFAVELREEEPIRCGEHHPPCKRGTVCSNPWQGVCEPAVPPLHE